MKAELSLVSEQFGTLLTGTKNSIFDLDRDEVILLFKSSSLLLFRNFDVDTDKFKAFTELFSTSFMTYVGGAYNRDMIKGDKTLLSVTGHKLTFAVPPHGEMYYKKNKPQLLWFYCAAPALKDGETTVGDGIQIYEELSPSTKDLFRTKRLKYIRNYPKEVWQEIYQTDDLTLVEKVCKEEDISLKIDQATHTITTKYICSALIQSRRENHPVFINNILPVVEQELQGKEASLVRFEDNSKIPDAVINELKEVTNRLMKPIQWQAGDILMIDNTRLLHGRRSFSDNQRDIYVRLCNAAFPF
jgi:alpha-ketoglutarate-dependent taurine dioxygenase